MKFIRLILFVLMLLVFKQASFSQVWLKGLEEEKKSGNQKIDFYDIRNSFNLYWTGKTIEKGKGWKQFKRWENFMDQRVYPEGNMELPDLWELSQFNLKSSQVNGSDWTNSGPFLIPEKSSSATKSGMGRINCIAFHPGNKDIIYVGSPSGGLWKTINGGLNWNTVTDKLLSLGVSDIAINPTDPNIIYIATGDGDAGDTYGVGILKSIDGGASWNTTNLNHEQSTRIYSRRIIINPTNPNILLVASNIGIYRTEDGFQTYSLIKSGNFKDLEFKPGNPLVIYASNYDSNGNARIFKSTNGGKTFVDFSSGLATNNRVNRIEIAVTPANSNCVYALCCSASNDGFYALFKSVDAGVEWTNVYPDTKKNLLGYSTSGNDNGGQGWYDLALAVHPTSVDDVYVGGVNIYKSTNSGATFTINAHWVGSSNINYVHADQHMLSFNPVNNFLYSCNDGGVYVSKDDGKTWTDISNGLNILQIYKISASSLSPDFFLTGNQDNGSFRSLDGVWEEINGGDGMECWIDPENDSIIYTSLYYGSFYRSQDMGKTFKYITPATSREGAWITPLVLSESNPSHIFAGYSEVFKSHNRGDNWFKISKGLGESDLLQSIAISPMDENYIYAATYNTIWITNNSGRSWKDISPGLSSKAITSVTISPNNPLKVWVTLSGYTDGEKVYYSENGGENWINYSDGLPNLPVNTMIYQKNSNEILYAGTDLGVFFRDQTMSAWEPYNNGLPNVIINDLDIQYSEKRLIAGSYGRGLWTSPLQEVNINSLFAEILVPSRYICKGDPFIISANTSSTYDSIVWNFPDGIPDQKFDVYEPVIVSFNNEGIKNIAVNLYHSGMVYRAELNAYVEVFSSPDIDIISYDTINFHQGSVAILSVSGARDYVWDNSPYLSSLTADLVTANPVKSTKFYVTGSAGSCSERDSFTIYVKPGPENDDVCSAIQLQTGLNGPFDNFFASVQKNEPLPDTTNCNTQMSWCEQEGGLQTSVWFKYKANGSIVSLSTEGFDTQIALYAANSCEDIIAGKYNILAANDDYYGSTDFYAAALKRVSVIAGNTYYIQVDGSAGGMTGQFYVTALDNALGIENNPEPNKKIMIYPNPSTGEVTLKIALVVSEAKFQVYDNQGKILLSEDFSSDSSFEKSINLPHKGVFLIRVFGDGIDFSEKVVIK